MHWEPRSDRITSAIFVYTVSQPGAAKLNVCSF